MSLTLRSATSTFGAGVKSKLSNLGATGEPEDQLRSPLDRFVRDLGELCRLPRNAVELVGESSVTHLKTRPDYAVTIHNALIGFIELKAPGKGADPRRFKEPHDKAQWEKLQSLPNLIYTDGNDFSLWRSGELIENIIHLDGDVQTSGRKLAAPQGLLVLFEAFFQWQPIAPSEPKQLAEICARLCRLLRDEVTEQLDMKSAALTDLATDWRRLLFPEASDAQFADGYAQVVTFALVLARARGIELNRDLYDVAHRIGETNSLIGSTLRMLTDDTNNQDTLTTSIGTMIRVLDAVDWPTVSKGDPDVWLYFYEDFLEVYDNQLRKQTGSYYTPPDVVNSMVRMVDEALRSPTRFNLATGLASPMVTIADPAVGTGTFLLGTLSRIARTVEADEGAGAVPAAITAAISRLIGFEMQLGPFAVAQLRLLAEVTELVGSPPSKPLRLFFADTLGSPYIDEDWFPRMLLPIAESRRQANEIKRNQPITVVIGNPPYREKAKRHGNWVEAGGEDSPEPPPLDAWIPPKSWGVSTHSKHLRNLYIYFWRWATWKVFDHHPEENTGIVCFITVAGFLNGPGFQRMRDYLRRKADEIWVIDCSPEGHQPEINTRIFQAVQQPVSIVLVSRSPHTDDSVPATVRYVSLPAGHRQLKFDALANLALDSDEWIECPLEWRAPFLPESHGAWSTYPTLEDLFVYNGSGVMPGRTWIIAPDQESLRKRWMTLVRAPSDYKETLFHPHLRNGKPGDKHSKKVVPRGLPGYIPRPISVAEDAGPCVQPVPYGFRSFDRQWIIPDIRLINQPNPKLWEVYSKEQVYLTAPSDRSPTVGPALTFTSLIPDLHHYHGRGGRVFPLWQDSDTMVTNVSSELLRFLESHYQESVIGEDLFAYIAAVAANPAYTARFQNDLLQPGLRIPMTTDSNLFWNAVGIGCSVIWLHTYGERFVDAGQGRPFGPPRLPSHRRPRIPLNGPISQDPMNMPDTIDYDTQNKRLLIGGGFVEPVEPQVWEYEVSGTKVIRHWFSYRKKNRDRPIIGTRRPPSPLSDIHPDRWLPEYTSELINLLNVLALLVDLEPSQEDLLEKICAGPTFSADELQAVGALSTNITRAVGPRAEESSGQQNLFA